ncbi:MAG TPA: hypothetical protein VFD40_01430, partial [Candidatus Paceibacterota bacterium]|nr:hypothetical protein [Candidatus Paceibacterota bacterium]
MAGKVIKEEEMIRKIEVELKELYIEKKNIEKEITKRTNKLVCSQPIFFYKDLEHIEYKDVLATLRRSLRYNCFRWLDLTLSFPVPTDKPDRYNHTNTPKIQIFLFGKKELILEKIEEISERIVNGKRWVEREVGVSLDKEFSIKDFI